jgi:hypothetical protein
MAIFSESNRALVQSFAGETFASYSLMADACLLA